MKKSVLLLFLFSSITFIYAQTEEKKKQLPSVAIGMGILSFNGDVGSSTNLSSFSKIRGGYTVTIEQRIKKIIGLSVTGIYGKLADSENSKTGKLNFETSILQADLNLVIHLDNDIIFKRSSSFAPYIFGGIGFLKFDPYGDLKNANGIKYNYWSDGTIKDKAENDPLAASATNIQRDYKYETQLKDSVNYSRSALIIPVGAGVTLKISEKLGVNLGATYYLALSDWLDNKKVGSNDKYLFSNASLKYTFGKKEGDNSAAVYKTIDFSQVDKTDTDGDGVSDGNDKCPGTPKGVQVNNKGCPDDIDDDGVPDYKDKELKTTKGAYVDENGVTITEDAIAKRQETFDSLATPRSQLFNENPSLKFLKEVEKTRKTNPKKISKVPLALQPADKDKDGYITADEITAVIDAFFEAESIFTVEKINDLIDYFFEQ